MELHSDKFLENIHNCTPEAIKFIHQWFDDSPYIIAHTSGSTGTPKEIRLLKSDMVASALSTNEFFGIKSSSKLLCPLSADYIAGKMMIVRAIVSGAQLWMEVPSNTPIQRHYGQIDLIAVVPSQLNHILTDNSIMSQVQNILVGGAQLPSDSARQIIDAGINAYVSYGMTETCSHVALRKIVNQTDEIYEAMPDVYFSCDQRDCLIIHSDIRSFKELLTNDIVKLIDERHFVWIGRVDNVINSGGIKIYPEDVEQQIQSLLPAEIEYYIAKSTDEKWGEVPVLVISKEVGDKDNLLNAIRNRVKLKAQRPARIIVAEIEHTSSGKIIRRQFKN